MSDNDDRLPEEEEEYEDDDEVRTINITTHSCEASFDWNSVMMSRLFNMLLGTWLFRR